MLARIKNSSIKDRILPAIFLSLFIALAYYNLFIFEKSRPGKLLQEAAEHMEANSGNLEISIQEKGLGYSLNFSGKKKGEEYFGNFLDYKLQVYKNSAGSIFVKDLKDGIWKEAEELGLEKIRNFFVSPFKLLENYSSSFNKAKFVYTPGKENRIISLDISAPLTIAEEFYPDGFPSGSLNIEFLIYVEEEQPFVRELVISLYEKESLRTILSRAFSFQSLGSRQA